MSLAKPLVNNKADKSSDVYLTKINYAASSEVAESPMESQGVAIIVT